METYDRLLNRLLEEFPGGDYRACAEGPSSGNRCVIRHDVDRWSSNARILGRMEAERAVRTSYYFRTREITGDQDTIRELVEGGHEIGYHYEVLAQSSGDMDEARRLFERDLAQLREIYPVATVAMHGSPLSKYNNIDFWQRFSLDDFGLAAEAFDLVDDPSWIYVTDTGRSWSTDSANLRDHAPKARTLPDIRSSADLIAVLDTLEGNLCLVVHPERWNRFGVRHLVACGRDWTFNTVKRALCVVRPTDRGC